LSGTTRATETRTAPEIGGVSLQLVYQIRFDVDVYGSVPGECPTPLFVSAEAADQVGILHDITPIYSGHRVSLIKTIKFTHYVNNKKETQCCLQGPSGYRGNQRTGDPKRTGQAV